MMDLISNWEQVGGQGLLFWSAMGAVALGITLILTAGVIHLRKFQARKRVRSQVPLGTEAVTPPAAGQVPANVEIMENSKASSAPATRSKMSLDPRVEQELLLLSARLRSAIDRLEELQLQRNPNAADKPESSLKDSQDGVDYLFRAGTG
jgi:hypothetical protein